MAFYSGIRQEHWLRDKRDEGALVVLEDGSMWEIDPSDRSKTVRWLRISTITVERFREYFRAGLPVTLATLLFGWAWVSWVR